MARTCIRYKRTRSGKRCAKYGGYGQPLKVFSGFGDPLDIGLEAFLPPLVGGGTALGTSLLLRAFVDPEVKDAAGAPVIEGGQQKIHWAFKYAGLIGGGAGILTSAILGPFQGWGSALSGAFTSIFGGMIGQFINSVVPEEKQQYRGYGRYGLVAAQPRFYGALPKGAYGNYGAIGASPVTRRFAVPGRAQGMPAGVLASVNKLAFGGSPTLNTQI